MCADVKLFSLFIINHNIAQKGFPPLTERDIRRPIFGCRVKRTRRRTPDVSIRLREMLRPQAQLIVCCVCCFPNSLAAL